MHTHMPRVKLVLVDTAVAVMSVGLSVICGCGGCRVRAVAVVICRMAVAVVKGPRRYLE